MTISPSTSAGTVKRRDNDEAYTSSDQTEIDEDDADHTIENSFPVVNLEIFQNSPGVFFHKQVRNVDSSNHSEFQDQTLINYMKQKEEKRFRYSQMEKNKGVFSSQL